jgi:hypothetical protein
MTGPRRDGDPVDANGTDGNANAETDRATDTGSETDADSGGDGNWPADLRGVTESVVTTLGPNDRWNCAALGLLVDDGDDSDEDDSDEDDSDEDGGDGDGSPRSITLESTTVTARTWGRTRTWRNFREEGEGYVQFVHDPVVFTEAALSIREERSPVLDAATAWVRVEVKEVDGGESDDTEWVEWALRPRESRVRRETVPTINRGHGAVIEATVAASRLDVAAYDTEELLDRLAYFENVVERCGGPREREAFASLTAIVGRRW